MLMLSQKHLIAWLQKTGGIRCCHSGDHIIEQNLCSVGSIVLTHLSKRKIRYILNANICLSTCRYTLHTSTLHFVLRVLFIYLDSREMICVFMCVCSMIMNMMNMETGWFWVKARLEWFTRVVILVTKCVQPSKRFQNGTAGERRFLSQAFMSIKTHKHTCTRV